LAENNDDKERAGPEGLAVQRRGAAGNGNKINWATYYVSYRISLFMSI